MADFRKNGYSYEVIIRPWKKKGRYEYIKWVTGLRNLWERITKEEFENAKKQ